MIRSISLETLLSVPGTPVDDVKNFSGKELHAISMGLKLAHSLGYFGDGASNVDPAVTVARIEGQLTVKRVRDQNLSEDDLTKLVLISVFNLVQRTNKAKNKPTMSLAQFLRSMERPEGGDDN